MFWGKEEKIPSRLKQQLLSRIRPILAKHLKVGEEKIIPEAKLVEELGIDSLEAVEIIMELEEAFDIEIMDADAEKMKIVDEVLEYLAKRIKQ